MRKYYFVLAQPMDVERRRQEADQRIAPRHFFLELAARMHGHVLAPDRTVSQPVRRDLLYRILKTPAAFIALARQIADQVENEDVVFCLGEAVSLPIAHELRLRGKTTRLASFGHNLQRPRIIAASLLGGVVARVDMFFVFTQDAVKNPAKYMLYTEQTDDSFFSYRPATVTDTQEARQRPLLVSVGLEMRDNVTLAEATRDLDVAVRITAFSKDAAHTGRAVPQPLPANMTARFYSWQELVDLYSAADIVVVPLCPATYAAGITSILEAAAVGKPVIATDTKALRDAFSDPDSIVWVPAEDAGALKQAITVLLQDPARRKALAQRAAAAQKAHHAFQSSLDRMCAALEALSAG